MGPLLAKLTDMHAPKQESPMSKEMEIETRIAMEGKALALGVMGLGPVAPYTCPECHGVLVRLKEGGVPRFRCHTGHAYSINTLLAESSSEVEHALWSGLRAVEESMLVLRELSAHIREHNTDHPAVAEALEEKAREAERRADVLRGLLVTYQSTSEDNVTTLKQRGD
jgi:two-component system chemotaxis response regulator CheB